MYAFITQTSGPYDDHCRPCRENAIAAGLNNPSQQELTSSRAERRELKKKQVAQKQAQKQDVDLNNRYNHTEKNKFKISDLGSAQLSKRWADAFDRIAVPL